MANNDISWGCCELGIEDERFIKCSSCKKAYHYACLSAPLGRETEASKSTWTCMLCSNSKTKQNNKDSTPVRVNPSIQSARANKRQASSPPELSESAPTASQIREIVRQELGDLFSQLKSSICLDLQTLKNDMQDMKESMNFMSHQYDDFVKDYNANKDTVQELQTQNIQLQETVHGLSLRLNQIEQHALRSNVEIQCVPEKVNENLLQMVKNLGNVISSPISSENITLCTRVAKMNTSNPRPRSIIVQFNPPSIRDHFIAAAISYNKSKPLDKLNSTHLGLEQEKVPIFVTEHLSVTNKALHAAARQKKRELGYKYVWVRDGKIYMRKNESSQYIVVKNKDTLDKLV